MTLWAALELRDTEHHQFKEKPISPSSSAGWYILMAVEVVFGVVLNWLIPNFKQLSTCHPFKILSLQASL